MLVRVGGACVGWRDFALLTASDFVEAAPDSGRPRPEDGDPGGAQPLERSRADPADDDGVDLLAGQPVQRPAGAVLVGDAAVRKRSCFA